MTAETLREAARVLRERAENATPGRWKVWGMTVMADTGGNSNVADATDVARTLYRDGVGRSRTFDADYIATVDPGFGSAVADLLDFTANEHEGDGPEGCWECTRWLTVARAILGGSA